MTSSKSKLSLIVYYFFALLIIFLPLQRLIEQILLFRFHFSSSLAFWTTHFYEPLIIIVLLTNFILLIKNREIKSRTNWISIVVLLLIVLSVISAFLLSPSLSRGLEGIRFSIFFLLAFLAGYLSDFDSKQRDKLINVYLTIAAVIALWAILERFLPANYLMKLKLIDPDSCFGYGTHRIGTIWQSVTGIGGPNQLGSYLLPAIFIAITRVMSLRGESRKACDEAIYSKRLPQPTDRLRNDNFRLKTFLTVLVIFGITAVILSFSRSAWAGLYAGFIVYLILFVKNIKLQVAGLAILIIIAALGLNYYLDSPNDILTHGASSESHQNAYQLSVTEIKNRFETPVKLIFGSGIGTAGPAALKYGDGFVSESWYLQLALEIGVLGLLLWLILIALLLTDLYKKNQGLFLGLAAVSVTAVFLHTFADNPALSITLFLLIGILIPKKLKE